MVHHMFPTYIRKYFRYLSISKMDFVSVFLSLGGITILVISLCAPILYWTETGHPDANIKSGEDAVWLSFMIVTTIGFGDFYPVTTLGRIIAVPLAATGISVFGTLAGYLGSLILDSVVRQATTDMLHAQNQRIEELSKQNNELNEHIKQIASENKDLNTMIVKISEQNEAMNRQIQDDTKKILNALEDK